MVELVQTYIAHRLASGERAENLRSASLWAAWLAQHYYIEPVCPWIVLASVWPEDMRELGLEIDAAAVRRCSAIVLCGPEMSNGMRFELASFSVYGPAVHLIGIDVRFIDSVEGRYNNREQAITARLATAGIWRRDG